MRQYNTDDYNTLKSSNMIKGIVGEDMRFDSVEAASVFFARELDQVKAKTYDKQYRSFQLWLISLSLLR